MAHRVNGPEAAQSRQQYIEHVILPLSREHRASAASLDRVRRSYSVAVDGGSGSGKGHHMAEMFRMAAVLGVPLVKPPQVTTRPPRDEHEANGNSAYEHLDTSQPGVRAQLEDDLREGRFLQVHVRFSKLDPKDPAAPKVPVDFYATRPEAADLTPGHITVFELVADETDRLVHEGVFRRAHTIVPTTAYRWLDHFHGRENGLPDDTFGRFDEGISAIALVRSVVEREQDLPPREKSRFLVLNDYGEGGHIPASRQLLGLMLMNVSPTFGRFDPMLQAEAFDESAVLQGFMEDLRDGRIRTLDDRIVAAPPVRPARTALITG